MNAHDVLFWAAYSVTMLAALGLMLGVRGPVRALAGVIVAGLVVCGLSIMMSRLPPEDIGNILICSPIGVMYLVLFSVLTRGKK